MVQRNGARGVVDAKVHTPSGSSEACYVTELDSGTHKTHFRHTQRLVFLLTVSNRSVTSPLVLWLI